MRRLCTLLLLAGCHHAETSQTGSFAVPIVAEAPATDPVVATVDGRPIRASDVAVQAGAAGTSTRQALDDLIDAEVLAGAALARGLDRDPAALEAAREAAVRRYLATSFEKEITPDSVPERDVRRWFNARINQFDHSQLVDVWHILVPTTGATPEQKQAARALAETLAQKARKVKSAEEFKALADGVTSPTQPLKVEQVLTARDGWTERPFSEAAFVQLKNKGDTTGVVETSYGYHVEYLNRWIPPIHIPLSDVAPKIRKGLFPTFQQKEFPRWVADLAKSHQVTVHPERLK